MKNSRKSHRQRIFVGKHIMNMFSCLYLNKLFGKQCVLHYTTEILSVKARYLPNNFWKRLRKWVLQRIASFCTCWRLWSNTAIELTMKLTEWPWSDMMFSFVTQCLRGYPNFTSGHLCILNYFPGQKSYPLIDNSIQSKFCHAKKCADTSNCCRSSSNLVQSSEPLT